MCSLKGIAADLMSRFPQADITVNEFSSGACMLDIIIGGNLFVIETPAQQDWYGVSKVNESNSFTRPDIVVKTLEDAWEQLIRIVGED